MNHLWITVPVLLFAMGCSNTRVVSSEALPVYGTDPLMHTIYLGSDAEFHHFALQHGKSASKALVRRADAQIRPEPFGLGEGRHAFVQAVSKGHIQVLVLQRAP